MSRTKATLKKRLDTLALGLVFSKELFGNVPDCDFELSHYARFINRVGSRDNLICGLKELDPFVDDAFAVAEMMSEEDFREFKAALVHERNLKQDPDGQSIMPPRYYPIVIPERFITAQIIAEKFDTTLEVALLRIMQTENGF